MAKDSAQKISYTSKEIIVCPVCAENFRKEELLTGSGRLIAGALTDELHRLYEPSSKYGSLYPLAYQAVVCPKCLFASMNDDFPQLPESEKDMVALSSEKRREEIDMIFPEVSFYEPRTLISGAASQYLVMRCYDYYNKNFSPTVKQGLASLRAGWLFEEMDKTEPGQHYDWLAALFKRKACFFYSRALQNETEGIEKLSALNLFGPDTDKNYGYEGFLYITGFLEFQYGGTKDIEKRNENLVTIKRTLAKMFGLGRSSKNKPGPLLEKSKKLYNDIAKEIEDFDD